jgi:hypothetical protein
MMRPVTMKMWILFTISWIFMKGGSEPEDEENDDDIYIDSDYKPTPPPRRHVVQVPEADLKIY